MFKRSAVLFCTQPAFYCQSAFYTQSVFYPWPAVHSLRFTLTTLRFKVARYNDTTSTRGMKQLGVHFGSIFFYFPLKVAWGNPQALPLNDGPAIIKKV